MGHQVLCGRGGDGVRPSLLVTPAQGCGEPRTDATRSLCRAAGAVKMQVGAYIVLYQPEPPSVALRCGLMRESTRGWRPLVPGLCGSAATLQGVWNWRHDAMGVWTRVCKT